MQLLMTLILLSLAASTLMLVRHLLGTTTGLDDEADV